MNAVQYLTVQDMLWINLQVTGAPQGFRFDLLEESTYYQYGYGGSRDIVAQAERFLNGFVKHSPFEAGNLLTGFVGYCAFLEMNGYRLATDADQVTRTLQAYASQPAQGAVSFRSGVQAVEGHHAGEPDVRGVVESVMERFSNTIGTLGSSSAAA